MIFIFLCQFWISCFPLKQKCVFQKFVFLIPMFFFNKIVFLMAFLSPFFVMKNVIRFFSSPFYGICSVNCFQIQNTIKEMIIHFSIILSICFVYYILFCFNVSLCSLSTFISDHHFFLVLKLQKWIPCVRETFSKIILGKLLWKWGKSFCKKYLRGKSCKLGVSSH